MALAITLSIAAGALLGFLGGIVTFPFLICWIVTRHG